MTYDLQHKSGGQPKCLDKLCPFCQGGVMSSLKWTLYGNTKILWNREVCRKKKWKVVQKGEWEIFKFGKIIKRFVYNKDARNTNVFKPSLWKKNFLLYRLSTWTMILLQWFHNFWIPFFSWWNDLFLKRVVMGKSGRGSDCKEEGKYSQGNSVVYLAIQGTI